MLLGRGQHLVAATRVPGDVEGHERGVGRPLPAPERAGRGHVVAAQMPEVARTQPTSSPTGGVDSWRAVTAGRGRSAA